MHIIICQTLEICGNSSLCDNPVLSRFMKGIFVAKPPKPKYTCTWDVSKVLKFLNTLWPLQNLSLKELTLKLVALLALSTAQRVQTLGCLKLNLLSDFGDYLVFTIDKLTKTSKPGKTLQKCKIHKHTNKRLCVVHTLKYYIKTTVKLRKSQRLLISFKTYNEVSTSTIARWLKTVLHLAGIDTSIFTAHSFRGYSTSKAFACGVSLSDILRTANWSNVNTFHIFYNRQSETSYSSVVLAKD